MNNQKLVLVSIMLTIVSSALLVLNPSINAQAQLYNHDDSQYAYDDNYNKNYYPEPKSSHTDIQKIKCVNSNLNVNGIDINQIPNDDLATAEAANEGGPDSIGAKNGNNAGNKINFDRKMVNVCVNVNDNQQVRAPPATLSVSKTISCDFETSEGQEACSTLLHGQSFPQGQITPDEFSIQVTGNNPNPSQFDGSTNPVRVTLSAGNYQVTETPKTSIQQAINVIETSFPSVDVIGPIATFSDDCTQSDSFEATGAIAQGESQVCNIENKFTANALGITVTDEPFGNTVSVIDTKTNTIIGSPITVGNVTTDIAFDSKNNRMYVTNFRDGTVSVIDTATNTVIGFPIPVGASMGIAFDSKNNRMYVTNFEPGTVTVIDTSTNTVTDTINVGDDPWKVAFDSKNNRMYVTDRLGDSVFVIDTATNTVIGSPIPVGNDPRDIAFDSKNNRMYVTDSFQNVSVIDTATNTVIGSPITVGTNPNGIAFDSKNNRMYVVNTNDDAIVVIDTATNTVIGSPITVGDRPGAIEFDSKNKRMYVGNTNDGSVSVIDTKTNTLIGSPILVGDGPTAMAFDTKNKRIYVTNGGGE